MTPKDYLTRWVDEFVEFNDKPLTPNQMLVRFKDAIEQAFEQPGFIGQHKLHAERFSRLHDTRKQLHEASELLHETSQIICRLIEVDIASELSKYVQRQL